ncbi:hypothetical protein [Streptomyces sp. NPDC002133]|uniref:hypothetical protein n=1 Tax=Streptomyces sp. NPDC002133 TaxID=3154409 RepID=UPI003319513B
MGSEGRRTVRRPPGQYVCPACGQPVGTVIKRRKILGAFVPEWVRGPCHNPDCGHGAEHAEGAGAADLAEGGGGAGATRHAKGSDGEPTEGRAAGSAP